MGTEDALPHEMRHLFGPGHDPQPLDGKTAERLLSGVVAAADAPPGYAHVAQLIAAATAPPSRAELAGQAAAVAAFAATHRPVGRTRVNRRFGVLGKLLTIKAVAATVLGAATVTAAATAATGNLPDTAQAAAHSVLGSVGVPAPESSEAAKPADAASASAAQAGLCTAWAAGKGGEKGAKLDAPAFARLAKAAGGADKVEGYCAAYTADRAGSGQASSDSALVGLCKAWTEANQQGTLDKLEASLIDRLTTAAGGTEQVASFCAQKTANASSSSAASPAARATSAADHGRPTAPPAVTPTPRATGRP